MLQSLWSLIVMAGIVGGFGALAWVPVWIIGRLARN